MRRPHAGAASASASFACSADMSAFPLQASAPARSGPRLLLFFGNKVLT